MTEYRRGSASTIASSTSDASTISSDCQITVRLLELMHKTEYELVQENGQRRLTAPELTKEHREHIKGSEVFLGRLPRDCYEDELMPVLERAGRLLELRLMLDFSGTTRGYAFALYQDAKTARKAVTMLDGYHIRPGHPIGAVKSVDNCRLFFGGVPKDKSKEEFMEELSKLMDGIVDIYLYPNAQDKTLNRGFIFVEFKDHRSAAMARRKLIPGRVLLWDHEVAVDWADPEPGEPVDEDIMENVTALFVRNLAMNMPQQKIREIFQRTTNIPILKLKKINHFAFVHYESRELAEKVMQIMTQPGSIADLEQWEIRWAKPIGPIKQAERQRCINEAISESRHQKDVKVKKIVKKQYLKTDEPNQHYAQEALDLQYVTILTDFVAKTLQAMCSFECLTSSQPPGFIHKITIFRDNILIFEDFGTVQPTKQQSLNCVVSIVYQKLKSAYEYNVYHHMYPSPIVNDISAQMMHLNVSDDRSNQQLSNAY
ncbi:probable RNA-binding protein 46 [Nasonia vitripennis]|uniref:RRM domain-containing protein n=1 Tax=Nasonia vitripennis TaxID=7425 RepID=A0A7M7Q913_NASVI|nr:probable RNA-binding protein 46 [Nasonia vitripennis]XP_031782268.1 probable RNA-binding protein 46 [Nasonia vitripennis]XP_031782269.1 probable RNA-binding protein 46 [Nasonia vitripennis]